MSRRERVRGPEVELEERAQFVLQSLGLTWKKLLGKNVLDVGAAKAELAEAAQKSGIHVLSLDIDKSHAKTTKEKGLPYLVASANKTGLPDEFVDIVVSHAGPISGALEEGFLENLLELYRVVKVGGEIRFGPFYNANDASVTVADSVFAFIKQAFPQVKMRKCAKRTQLVAEYTKFYFSITKDAAPRHGAAPQN